MDVVIIKNAPNEGPGNLVSFFAIKGFEYKIIEAYTSNTITIPADCSFVVVLGGPMGVYEMESFPFLKSVARAIENSLASNIKILGICLGAQLLAHVLGSKVYPGITQEIGWCNIELTETGVKDPCFKNFKNKTSICKVFQWHGDTFDLPKDASLLASSTDFTQQVFRYNESYGLQFHPEITPSMIKDWCKDIKDLREILIETETYFLDYWHRAWLFYSTFFVENAEDKEDSLWKDQETKTM
ncbi:MAG TPA: type 1 glutamine amidotransferase [Syntrophorhabdaceae bacterium]|nr:type 1 glutamine amidotransferase [Syntrophorhabdaceae bacterium]HOT41745.1 type 1 glutamine amidotransferase [Syntrophorhabdaceae bacterium]HPC67171.1 type 1 glutamine amidotransferase [Syntrophorhabdaceae bacterium]HQE80721.1 type 1 glutamine amidotransferase [Syntrophorhabdaceae bacterium]HQH42319.1 type 1 glutamine amidotransferase [Syntrophorhabdaceae bacterium]